MTDEPQESTKTDALADARDSAPHLGTLDDLDDEQANRAMRRVWHKGRWFFSVIDAIALLTLSPNPRRYWSDMKRDLATEGFPEVYAQSVQLKMRAPDGKERLTDAADAETLLRLVQ